MKLQEALDSIDDAIAVATSSLGLLPGVAFQARVLQLAHLSNAHKSVSETDASYNQQFSPVLTNV